MKIPDVHTLKTIQPYFNLVGMGAKNFELRKMDRNFKVDDFLILKEYNTDTDEYGSFIYKKISYILIGAVYGLSEGYCILSLKPVSRLENCNLNMRQMYNYL